MTKKDLILDTPHSYPFEIRNLQRCEYVFIQLGGLTVDLYLHVVWQVEFVPLIDSLLQYGGRGRV